MNRITIGVIGCGKQAGKHVSALEKIPGVEIVLADLKSELARALGEQRGHRYVEDVDVLFNDREIRALIICTPTPSHHSLIVKSFQSGKDVFCEKPLCESVSEAEELKTLADRTGRLVQVGYIYRFAPAFETGHMLFCEDAMDGVSQIMGRSLWAFFRIGGRGGHQFWKHNLGSGGGAINEMLVHMVDLANWYFGPLEDVRLLRCQQFLPERTIQKKTEAVDAEDFVIMQCRGIGGVSIYCQADLVTPAFSQYVEVQSENGSFMGSIQPDMPSYVHLNRDRAGFKAGKNRLNTEPRNLIDLQMFYFISALRTNRRPLKNTVAESVKLIEIVTGIKSEAKKIWTEQ